MMRKKLTIPRGLVRFAPVVALPPRLPKGDKRNVLRVMAVAKALKEWQRLGYLPKPKPMTRIQRRRWLALLDEVVRKRRRRRRPGRPRSEKRSADHGR